ncbi:MAG: GNAT family N-acetyltransferase [Planctomycetes bacterium]|nr:GNAT family N-acetyltransferase [Planctomycetota bacterium]
MLNLDWKPPTLETPRLILRPLEESDAPDIFLYASNPNVTRFTLWEAHETIDDTLAFLGDYPFTRYPNKEPDPVGIILKDDPTRSVIGTVGCFWVSRKDGVMELGYNLAEPYWGRGIIVEAARMLLDFVFREYQVNRVQARVLGGNDASGRVACKLGMNHEGTLRATLLHRGNYVDVHYYALLRGEWADHAVKEADKGC